jgi:hypothetical protein
MDNLVGNLAGKIAIVTGASRGIGKAIAIALAKEGAKIVINYASSATAAEALVQEIQDRGGEAIALAADVSKREQVDELPTLYRHACILLVRWRDGCSPGGAVYVQKTSRFTDLDRSVSGRSADSSSCSSGFTD